MYCFYVFSSLLKDYRLIDDLDLFQALTLIIIQLERLKGNITSGILFLFYLLSTIAEIIPFYTYIIQKVRLGLHHVSGKFGVWVRGVRPL